MKISGTNDFYGAGGIQAYQPRGTYPAAGQRGRLARRFDSVSIGESAAGRGAFRRELQSRLTQEVRAGATPGRLSSLSRQIQDGSYQPDALSIARRMLRMTEEA